MRPITNLHTDACSEGCGGVYNGDYFYINWKLDLPDMYGWHINFKETFAIIAAAFRWGHLWKNKRVLVYSDNTTAVSLINKGSTKNCEVMKALRSLFWLSAVFNFSLCAVFLPGKDNSLADACSRLHDKGQLSRLYGLMPSLSLTSFCVSDLSHHMSPLFLFSRWGQSV